MAFFGWAHPGAMTAWVMEEMMHDCRCCQLVVVVVVVVVIVVVIVSRCSEKIYCWRGMIFQCVW